jgi:hypothetical protein
MATCNLCGENLPEKDMAEGIVVMTDHLRLWHSDEFGEGPERWPDGAVVVYEPDAEPDDATPPSGLGETP